MRGLLALALGWGAAAAAAPPTSWVSVDPAGKLVYARTARGDRIMDFSSAGYGGGGKPLPEAQNVFAAVSPSGGDDAAAIQAAVDRAAIRPIKDWNWGVVRLAAGTFHCSAPIVIHGQGVVIRGAGPGAGGTTILLGGSPHTGFEIGSGGRRREEPDTVGAPVHITEGYVPAGAVGMTVDDAGSLAPGDPVLVVKPVTAKWVAFMGMDQLVRDGRPEHWVRGEIRCERTVRAVDGNRVELDVPLSDSLDRRFLGGEGATLVKYRFSEPRSSNVGLEHLRIVAPVRHVSLNGRQFSAASFRAVEDAWMRDVAIEDTTGSVGIGEWSRRITVEDVNIVHHWSVEGAALPADFALAGSQTLIERCRSKGNRIFFVVTQAAVCGPNVVWQCDFEGNGSIMPHQRWATGLLVDSCRVPDGGIELQNRGQMGSGHGWTIGWGVAWNCSAKTLVIQDPPGALNWAIGCTGEIKEIAMPFEKAPLIPTGEVQSPGRPVQPASLYLAQLQQKGST